MTELKIDVKTGGVDLRTGGTGAELLTDGVLCCLAIAALVRNEFPAAFEKWLSILKCNLDDLDQFPCSIYKLDLGALKAQKEESDESQK